jgi:hypothetical protein
MGQVIEFPGARRPQPAPRRPRAVRADGLLAVVCWLAYLGGFFVLAPLLAYAGVASVLLGRPLEGLVELAALAPLAALTRAAWRRLPAVA